ncbi:MAG: hypothetical protein RLY78_3430 [Pseudomonadota bacterium]|jgi:uncharacterized membrane protein|uniref:DUF2282 domain-containing protein n=1 Tax=Pseudaquabacterium rugosum TaxID=2984194 RepID=A0ABU9B8G8_9BURK
MTADPTRRPADVRSVPEHAPPAAGRWQERVALAVGAALALGLGAAPAAAHEAEAGPGQEKCYGIAKAGENHCASLSGRHDCAGQSTIDRSPDEWQMVPKGRCKALGGLDAAQARAALKRASRG